MGAKIRFRLRIGMMRATDSGLAPHLGALYPRSRALIIFVCAVALRYEAAGLPLEFISKQLRHSELETTRKHYARWLRPADLHWLNVANTHAAADLGGPNRPSAAKKRLRQADST